MATKSRKRFTVMLPQILATPEMKEELVLQAQSRSLTSSDIVRAALEYYFKAHPIEKQDDQS